jgi:hypothetical protein
MTLHKQPHEIDFKELQLEQCTIIATVVHYHVKFHLYV